MKTKTKKRIRILESHSKALIEQVKKLTNLTKNVPYLHDRIMVLEAKVKVNED